MLQRHAAERIHRVEDAYTNFFIVEDGPSGGITIVDTGFPSSWGSLGSALADVGRKLADVEAVVLTHGHFDHMGFAARAQKELGVEIWAHEKEVPVVRHPWRYDHEQPRVKYALRHPKFNLIFTRMGAAGALFVKGVENPRTYGDSGTLEVPGRPHVVFTPGHTYGHCALHFPERGAVIAGDAIVMLNPYTGGKGPQIVAGAATADSAMNLASLDALAATEAQTVLTGHGEPWTGGVRSAVEQARSRGAS
jgi:glyoxylase-like metal-dependent hydrolase (beta-lactamase superfamily II)